MAGGGYGRRGPGVPLGQRGAAPVAASGAARPWETPTVIDSGQLPVPGTVTPTHRHAWLVRPGKAPAAVLVLRWSRSHEGWMAAVVMADEQDRGVLLTVPADQLQPVIAQDPNAQA